MGQKVLGLVESLALLSALHGLYFVSISLDEGLFATLHNCIWFIFAILSNAFGLIAILAECFEGRSQVGSLGIRTMQALQYHYFFSWMDLLVGYAGLVTHTWLSYKPVKFSHVHLALIGLPILAWLKRKGNMIVVMTQVVTFIAILSHSYVSLLAGNRWGLGGAVVMGLTLIAMSLPVRYTFFTHDFSTREAAILLSAFASILFSFAIGHSADYQRSLRKIFM